MEEVLTNFNTVRTGWIILLVQLVISIMVAMFIVKKARVELDRTLIMHNNQLDSEKDLKLVISEK